jgi:NAD(P)-dependent dehydrogenase (short-subunit alcohol dehydrogenase family)
VIVITGASSGIGLATARMAAKRGARGIVLAARSDDALKQLESEINGTGRSQAVAVPCDVGHPDEVRRVVDVATERFGGFDTWINNAGVSVYGRLTEVTDEDHHRLFQTNFWGVVNGSKAAVEHLRSKGGALINVGSVLSERAVPIQGMYTASKHAVKGFTDALRMELEDEGAPVSVTLIKPAAINTPYTSHAKNYMEDFPNNPAPVYAPDLVAQTLLYAAEHPVRDLFVGGAAKLFQAGEKYMPRVTDKLMEKAVIPQFHSGKPRGERDALFQPSDDLRQEGDYEGHVRRTSTYTAAVTHPKTTAIMVVGGLALLGAFAYSVLGNSERTSRRSSTGGLGGALRRAGSAVGGVTKSADHPDHGHGISALWNGLGSAVGGMTKSADHPSDGHGLGALWRSLGGAAGSVAKSADHVGGRFAEQVGNGASRAWGYTGRPAGTWIAGFFEKLTDAIGRAAT